MKKKRIIHYSVSLILLVLLVSFSFLLPRVVAGIQDNVQCGKMVLESKEAIDIAIFTNSYEDSLYQRLYRYAKGYEDGKQYYVTSCESKSRSEIEDDLFSEQGICRDKIIMLMDINFFPENLLLCKLENWKQYAIYGEDYNEGVNLIIQYVELKYDAAGITYKMLFDSQTGDIYGIKVENSKVRESIPLENVESNKAAVLSDILNEQLLREDPEYLYGLAYFFCGYFEERDLISVGYPEYDVSIAITEEEEEPNQFVAEEQQIEQVDFSQIEISIDGDQICIKYPFGDYFLTMTLSGKLESYRIKNQDIEIYDFLLGFREIYHLIPEFCEE